MCGKCGTTEAANDKGPPVCDGCRAPKKHYTRRVLLKTCTGCSSEFRTKSAANRCPRCLHREAKHPCADCGEPCDKRATRCLACSTARSPIGASNPNWKGGRTVSKLTGYVRVKRPDHPRAVNGYVLEHMVVMEDAIGRYLLPGETVHHRNGQRADNALGNLELWAKSQPSGQRVTDLLEWAHELIALYEPVVSVLP